MTLDEWSDYKLIQKLLITCDESHSWDTSICFEEIKEFIESRMKDLKYAIGERMIQEKLKEKK